MALTVFAGCGPKVNVTSYAGCAFQSKSYFPASAFGSFFVSIDTRYSNPPCHGLPGAPVPVWVKQFYEAHMVGAMSKRALQSPFIEQENAQKKEYLHGPTPWPLSPLMGLVVERTTGLLEVYQTHIVYRSDQGPLSNSESLLFVKGGLLDFTPVIEAPPKVHGGKVTYDILEEPPSPAHEHEILVGISEGPLLLALGFLGGRGITPELVKPYIQEAAALLARSCYGAA